MKYLLLNILFVIGSVQKINAACLSSGIAYPMPAGSSGPNGVAFSPDGSLLAIATINDISDVALFKVTDGVLDAGVPYVSPDVSAPSWSLGFSSDGALLAVNDYHNVTSNNNIILFRVQGETLTGGQVYPLPSAPGGGFQAVAFSPDNSLLAATAYFPPAEAVILFDVSGNTLGQGDPYTLPTTNGNPRSVAFSPDGSLLVTANYAFIVTLFKVVNGGLTDGVDYAVPTGSGLTTSVGFSSDGSLVAASLTGGNQAVALFKVTGQTLSTGVTYPLPYNATNYFVESAVFSPDGSLLVVNDGGNSRNSIVEFKVSNGTLDEGTVHPLPTTDITHRARGLGFSPDGKFLAVTAFSPSDVTIFKVDDACNSASSTTSSTASQGAQLQGPLSILLKRLFQ